MNLTEYTAFLAADAIRWTDGRENAADLYLTIVPYDMAQSVPYTIYRRLVAFATMTFTIAQFHTTSSN